MLSPFTSAILSWYDRNARQLPWRQTAAPYAIWLSEIILQQTRVEQGRAYWERFIAAYPTVEQLDAASEDEVLKLWQGLGYYSRARNLHFAARQIVQNGQFPTTYEGIRQLKGVGDYTAAAIASFAFNLPYATVDGNVYRVLARHFGIDTPINTTDGKKLFTRLAQELLPEKLAGRFNQAMMDFGATCCTPQSPHCGQCPLVETCEALRTNRVQALPVKQKKLKIRHRHFIYIYIRCGTQVALHRRGKGDIWQGLWEPYMVESDHLPSFKGVFTSLATGVKHVLTHQVILADFYRLEVPERPSLPEDYVWIEEESVADYAIPRLVQRLFEYLEE